MELKPKHNAEDVRQLAITCYIDERTLTRERAQVQGRQFRDTPQLMADFAIEYAESLGLFPSQDRIIRSSNGCPPGCKAFSVGETYHHTTCPHYKGSMSEQYDLFRSGIMKNSKEELFKKALQFYDVFGWQCSDAPRGWARFATEFVRHLQNELPPMAAAPSSQLELIALAECLESFDRTMQQVIKRIRESTVYINEKEAGV